MACVYFQDQYCKNIVAGCFSLELFKIKMQSSITQQDKRPKTFQFIPLCTKFSCFNKSVSWPENNVFCKGFVYVSL